MVAMQPHGFFNCSPAIDVPPSAGDMDSKDTINDVKDNGVAKPYPAAGILAKL